MDDFLPTQQQSEKPRRNIAFIIVVVFFGIIGIIALFNRNSVAINTNVTETAPFKTGNVVVINYGDNKYTTEGSAVLAVDLDTLNSFIEASQNGTSILDSLISHGKLFTTPNGTKARVIESLSSATKVRIVDGDSQGEEGWVSNVFLYE